MVEGIFDLAFVIAIGAATIRLTIPMLFAALGESISQRSGVVNMAIEGTMTVGAFSGFVVAFFTGNLWFGVAVAVLLGGLVGLATSVTCVTLRTNQPVTGIMLRILCWSVSAYLLRVIFGGNYIHSPVQFPVISVPLLSNIPLLGPIIFQQNILVYLAFALVPVIAFVFYRTTFGLKIIAVGENPKAADTMGIKVYSTRYLCVIIGSMLISLGGAYISLAYVPVLQEDVIGGRGWIALALVTFGRWDPKKILGGALLFSVADAVQMRLQTLGVPIPYQFFLMTPYILTLVVMIVAREASRPAALAQPYRRE